MRVDETSAAVLAALRPPEVPRPVVTAPIALPVSRMAIAGLALAIAAPPVGLVLSAIALANLLGGRWRARGENIALAGVVTAVLMVTALAALML